MEALYTTSLACMFMLSVLKDNFRGFTTSDLSHLVISNPKQILLALIQDLIGACTGLLVLICLFTRWELVHENIRHNDPWINDPCVVIMGTRSNISKDISCYARDWKSGLAGGPDFWVRAEEFLAKKHRDKNITTQVCDYNFESEGVHCEPHTLNW
ncbi:hypothetical protein MVEN_00257500 [Mycena venus]|uniref:Uncharacterized protein n=1 Tax=Mycena venus TaxID=2733690 RepID=A0A8H7DDT4_9AGAR|nr:hypothetical protein MVEN_00257500 [Mycena venus]